MNKLPIYFGYAGILPFAFFTVIIVFGGDKAHTIGLLQIAYAAMILSFLGGVHWGQAIPSNNRKQISFAMLPTIISLALFVLYAMQFYFIALIGTAIMFWVTFEADKKLMPVEHIPPGYFRFRAVLTYVVMALLTISAFAVL